METTSEKLEHMENLMAVMIDALKTIENKKPEIPEQTDYIPTFEKLPGHLEQISRQVIKANNLISSNGEEHHKLKDMIDNLPKKIKTQVEHRFSDRTRPYIIVFVVAIFVTALSVFGCISLLVSNSELRESDIKFRMVRLRKPSWAKKVDADYFRNADSLKRLIKFEEIRNVTLK